MSVENGIYILTNVKHKNLAVIRSEQGGAPLIAGIEEDSYKELWRIAKRSNGRYTISNFGNGFHARTPGRSKAGDTVKGRDQSHQPQLWDIRDTRVRGQYTIACTDTSLYWGLDNVEIGALITLYEGASDPRNWWILIPVEPTMAQADVSAIIAIKGIDGKYMKVTSTNGLEFSSTVLDKNGKFTVQPKGGKIALIGSNGKHVNMYYVDDVKCEGPGGGLDVGIAHRRNGKVCFTISGYQGQDGQVWFLSSQAGHPSYNGSLAVKRVEDESCRFLIENVAKVSGTIAVKSVDGRYLKANANDELEFSDDRFDDEAKFIVKLRGDRLNLIGYNGMYVTMDANMGGVSFVQCKGSGRGLTMGLIHLADGMVNFTISGYQGQHGKISFLSSRTGWADGSLAVVDETDETCSFVIENH
ncbi:hypothetical protein HETIRDRAFT_418288 [Heterobasidion irregulare TC 32-1]|uniref:Ricin B lectin domain-containing protein n=1 Tax=Heterobasidion irregulare (strain TC 32-1) TaxID=747525 RepID=W4K4I0_HETIT|nr:uncharacterized protein HETIRDRAFT_418288 [Heterobasidion irregulare TC 32-1]ETW80250.1 hypothetical protein HETIRDRAFT_418288 [Heterobasidion irregulare TC 32-1]